MKDINIRKLEKSDIDKIKELLATRDGYGPEQVEQRAEMMAWVAFNNPYTTNDEGTYLIAENGQKIVAYHGRMPSMFVIEGKPAKGYYIHDLYVDPEYRKKGLGFWITIDLAKTIEDYSDSFLVLYGMTPLNLQMQRRRGYPESHVPGYLKVLNPVKQLEKKLGSSLTVRILGSILAYVLKLLEFIWSPRSGLKANWSKIDRFDESFDPLFEQAMADSNNSTMRTSAYLNWKYIDRPYRREEVFSIEEDGNKLGYVILGFSPYNKQYKEGVIVDIMAYNQDASTISKLLKLAIKYFRDKKAISITCVASDERYIKMLKKYAFIQRPGKGLMLGNLDKVNRDNESFKNVHNWHFTIGDSDAYMLSS